MLIRWFTVCAVEGDAHTFKQAVKKKDLECWKVTLQNKSVGELVMQKMIFEEQMIYNMQGCDKL